MSNVSGIVCPGDILSYKCRISTNSETPHLTWVVTLPGETASTFTYGNPSTCNDVDSLNNFISTSLVNFTEDSFIESVFMMEVQQADITANQTQLACFISDLEYASTIVSIFTSGKLNSYS